MALVQILGVRSFVNEKGETKKFDKLFDVRAESLADLFQNLPRYLAKIPDSEKWNLFYTVAHCGEGKREFAEQHVLVFDLDGIDVTRKDLYHDHVKAALGVKECVTIFSGNGLHYIIGVAPITDKKFFRANKGHYKACLDKISAALTRAELPATLDSTVFDARRIMRLPGTMNRKPGKQEVMAKILDGRLVVTDFDLRKASGIPDVKPDEQVDEKFLKRYPKIDAAAVMDGCEFLKWANANPGKVSEPQWYSALSIVARFEDGAEACHKMSEGHKGYSKDETDQKIEQALNASGPRTCKSIGDQWDGCTKCPHYQKLTSPILIKGADYLRTADTGFRYYDFAKEKSGGVCYDDLQKHFDRTHSYKILREGRMCYVWDGKQYVEWNDDDIRTFAQSNVIPPPATKERNEFLQFAHVTEATRRAADWFADTTTRRMNFLNGVLNIENMDFLPHSPDRGFRATLPYNYEPHAKAPRFEQFMHDVTCGNESLAKMLMQFAGYSISNEDYVYHKALVLVGEGANGKSTFMNVLRMVAGTKSYSSFTLKDLQDEYNRQVLDGKLFNLAEETPSKSMLDSSVFKTLVGGGEVQARQIYKGPYIFRNRAKLLYACNELPNALDTTHGYLRRLLIAPFSAVFSKERGNLDSQLEKKLKAELPGILNAFMRSYHELIKQEGFIEPEVSTNVLNEYRSSIDTVKQWFDEKVDVYVNGSLGTTWTTVEALFANYTATMKTWNEIAVTKDKFCKTLPKYIPNYQERRKLKGASHDRQRVLIGVTLAPIDAEARHKDTGTIAELL